jgi:hypothetical protein
MSAAAAAEVEVEVDPLTIPSDTDAGRAAGSQSKGVLAIDMDDVLW